MKKRRPHRVPVVYVPCRSGVDVRPVVGKAAEKMGRYERIGLITTSQHLHTLHDAETMIAQAGKRPVIGGQILGCSVASAKDISKKVDAFLYIGSGMFHPSAFLREISLPLFVANPYTCEVSEYSGSEAARWKKKQKARIIRCLEARKIGVLISTKTGQCNCPLADEIVSRLSQSGRKAYLFAGNELTPDRLLGYEVDAWVNTACPRIVDDCFDKPVINPEELDLLLEMLA